MESISVRLEEMVENAATAEEIRRELEVLSHGIPWAHHLDLNGVETISKEQDEKFYNKAIGLKKFSDLGLKLFRVYSELRDLSKARVLDVASGEGGMSIAFAKAGAAEVLGVEGRPLYVERATFAARVLGVNNVRFMQGDVRKLDPGTLGQFDLVFVSGILHHLGQEDFWSFLNSISKVTKDMLFLYTHVSTADAVKNFRLQGPVTIDHGATGYLYREHADDATAEERVNQVRASLDNTFSFWATEESLLKALSRVGFGLVTKVFYPHPFSNYVDQNLRAVLVAKK